MEASQTFHQTVIQCIDRHQNPATAAPLVPSTYSSQVCSGYEIIHEFAFYKVALFEEVYKCRPSDLGLPIESLTDTNGQAMQGILVSTTNPKDPLRVRAFFRSGSQLQDDLMRPEQVLRENQTKEFKQIWEQDLAKVQPRALSKPGAAVSMSSLPGKIALFQAEKAKKEKEAKERAEAMANLLPEPLPAVKTEEESEREEAEEEEEEEEEKEETGMLGNLCLPSAQRFKKGKGAAKGKAKAKAKAKCKASPQRLPPNTSCQRPGPGGETKPAAFSSRDSVSKASLASASSGKRRPSASEKDASPTDKVAEKAMSYLKLINISAILEGSATTHGREVWQATSTLEVLERESPGSSEAIYLQSHVALAQLCQVLMM